jgi:hypothetical protein
VATEQHLLFLVRLSLMLVVVVVGQQITGLTGQGYGRFRLAAVDGGGSTAPATGVAGTANTGGGGGVVVQL